MINMKQKGGKALRGAHIKKPNPFEEHEKEIRSKQTKKERRKEKKQIARGKKRPMDYDDQDD